MKHRLKNILKHLARNAASHVRRRVLRRTMAGRRSLLFVEYLTRQLWSVFRGQPDIIVFSRILPPQNNPFPANKFFFDIAILETLEITGTNTLVPIRSISKVHWVIESKFERRTRSIVHDFAKLAIADSENKLFICTRFANVRAQLGVLAQAAGTMKGNIFVALLPHPSNWGPRMQIDVYEYDSGAWNII
jgi:hypothetical protein